MIRLIDQRQVEGVERARALTDGALPEREKAIAAQAQIACPVVDADRRAFGEEGLILPEGVDEALEADSVVVAIGLYGQQGYFRSS